MDPSKSYRVPVDHVVDAVTGQVFGREGVRVLETDVLLDVP